MALFMNYHDSFGTPRDHRKMPDAGLHGPWPREQRTDFASVTVGLPSSGRCPPEQPQPSAPLPGRTFQSAQQPPQDALQHR